MISRCRGNEIDTCGLVAYLVGILNVPVWLLSFLLTGTGHEIVTRQNLSSVEMSF